MSVRFLTKSRFKVGYECPTKLQYLDNKSYGNTNVDNSFLEALAEGGFQVGELAKIYHPGGIEITETDKDVAAAKTVELLQRHEVTIYEAAIKFENLFIKADVLVKRGDSVELIEVKAKSFDPREENPFYNKTSLKTGSPKLNSSWEPYIVDIAFQTHVFKCAFPNLRVSAYLMLADKSAVATVDGINQRFLISKTEKDRPQVTVAPGTSLETVGAPLLTKVDVNSEIKVVWEMTFENAGSFNDMVNLLSRICAGKVTHKSAIGSHCKSCEFKIGAEIKAAGKKSGFEECWSESAKKFSFSFDQPLVFDIWNFRKSQAMIEAGVFLMEKVEEEDISPLSRPNEPGLSSSERQWLQVEKVKSADKTPYFDREGLAEEMSSWRHPLHFIDFETTMAAIPFHKGRRPYEQIAFQFSHHTIQSNGTIVHQTEYINYERGAFPNFKFVRALMAALSQDSGTIFRYATHENTVLCQIREQLLNSDEPDRDELVKFIETITNPPSDGAKPWSGIRNMVDMCELVKKYFYHPSTKGSNSIKKVLPAILNESGHLKSKYSKPIYGNASGIASKNFENFVWIELDSLGNVVDPYKRLPPVFSDLDLETMDSLITDGSIADGGAAMTAYARMQFTEMSNVESAAVAKALLKYCELDTLAMVMIFEYWKSEMNSAASTQRKPLAKGDRACLPRKKSKKPPKTA